VRSRFLDEETGRIPNLPPFGRNAEAGGVVRPLP
jgi:hypothetical protein